MNLGGSREPVLTFDGLDEGGVVRGPGLGRE